MKPASLEVESPKGQHLVYVPVDQEQRRLTDLLRRANLSLNTRCGQRGVCDGCIIELLSGTVVHAASGESLTAGPKPIPIRACTYRLNGEQRIRVRIPPRALLAYQPQIVTDFRINVPRAHDPLLQLLLIDPETLPTEGTAAERICRGVARHNDGELPVRLCEEAQEQLGDGPIPSPCYVTVALQEDCWLVRNVCGEAEDAPIGAAIDIGTTTVAVLLVDLSDGTMLSRSAAFNQQIHLGDDVVTRITLCTQDPGMLGELQAAVANRTIRPLLAEAAAAAGISTERITCLSITGNTTMLHLLAGGRKPGAAGGGAVCAGVSRASGDAGPVGL
jgi:uncharacterized 2Fe-2S/4Fe-4S cluster protein (DUF4445 family)